MITIQSNCRSRRRRMGERGFLVNEPFVPLVMILILAVIGFFLYRSLKRDVRLLTAIKKDVAAWQTAEHAWHEQHAAFTASGESLHVATAGTARVLSSRADSLGWNVVIADDSVRKQPSACGVFEGPASYAPGPEVTKPGEVACWKRK